MAMYFKSIWLLRHLDNKDITSLLSTRAQITAKTNLILHTTLKTNINKCTAERVAMLGFASLCSKVEEKWNNDDTGDNLVTTITRYFIIKTSYIHNWKE